MGFFSIQFCNKILFEITIETLLGLTLKMAANIKFVIDIK